MRRGGLSIEDRAATTRNPRQATRRLLAYLAPYRFRLTVIVLLILVYTMLSVVGPYLMGRAIDKYIIPGDAPGLTRIALLMLAVYVAMWAAGSSYGRLMAVVAQRALFEIRKDLFDHMQTLPLRFYDRKSAGDLMSRLTNDIENINQLLSQNLVSFLSSTVTLVAVVGAMIILNPWLTLAAMIVVPFMFGAVALLMRRIGPAFRALQKELGALNGMMEETISGQRTIIAFDRQATVVSEFEVGNEKTRQLGVRANVLAGLVMPVTMTLNSANLAVVVGIGALLAVNGMAGVTVGMIATFTDYTRRFSHPLMAIANLFNSIVAALAGAERIFEVLDTAPQITDSPDAVALGDVKGHVVFEHVDFGYDRDVPVLVDVSLEAHPGQTIALVGPTGAGKTTIVNVLSRFYDVDAGRISIDGIDIRDLKQDSLRRQLGIVLQDTFLFADTVMENIRYGRLDASDEEVIAAARLANADGFIERLPDGYATELSERATNLSQGQRQLISIARAVLADPAILILDEATSSVDTRTEMQIQEALLRLMSDRTSFVIAHRLSTIRGADQILVIDEGRIVERGRHDELLAARGFYYRLYTSQFKGQLAELEGGGLSPVAADVAAPALETVAAAAEVLPASERRSKPGEAPAKMGLVSAGGAAVAAGSRRSGEAATLVPSADSGGTSDAAIEARGISYAYGDHLAVDGISFEVARGEILGFLGPNGAGKSTTIKILTGQLRPKEGVARVLGLDVTRHATQVQARIGVCFEEKNLYENMSARENLEFFARLFGLHDVDVGALLVRVGLEGREDDRVKDYSKGLRQRLMMARALLNRPDVLFLDEPTDGLDPTSAKSVRAIIRQEARRGAAVLLTTHDMHEADELSDHVAFLNEGKIVALDTPEELKLAYGRRQVRVRLRDGEGVREVTVSLDEPDAGERLERLVGAGGLMTIHTEEATLEDIFIQLTGRGLA